MKKLYSFLAVTTFVMVFALILMSQKPSSQNEPKAGTAAIPDEVNTIFKNSCEGCHSDGGSSMAKMHVNFAKWSEYTPDKQVSKAEDICKVLKKGSMPPKKFKAQHPDLVPTEAQVKSINDWANSLKKT